MRGFLAAAFAQDGHVVGIARETFRWEREGKPRHIYTVAPLGGRSDSLRGRNSPSLGGGHVPRDQLIPHLGIQVALS